MPRPRTTTPVLREPAQSKCTWTCHQSQFIRKFLWKMPDAPDTTSNKHRAWTLFVKNRVVFSQNWKYLKINKHVGKKGEKVTYSDVFSRMQHAYPRSPDALCATSSLTLGSYLMLVDNSQMFTIIWVDHQRRWFLLQSTIFGPKSGKVDSFRKGDRKSKQLWSSR